MLERSIGLLKAATARESSRRQTSFLGASFQRRVESTSLHLKKQRPFFRADLQGTYSLSVDTWQQPTFGLSDSTDMY